MALGHVVVAAGDHVRGRGPADAADGAVGRVPAVGAVYVALCLGVGRVSNRKGSEGEQIGFSLGRYRRGRGWGAAVLVPVWVLLFLSCGGDVRDTCKAATSSCLASASLS